MLLWLSDLHLDRASAAACRDLFARAQESSCEQLVVTGDISHASRLVQDLERICDAVKRPVYFVLGNHDHFGASIAAVRDAVTGLAERRPEIRWLPPACVIALNSHANLVGVDGWADGGYGDPLGTPLRLNDDRLIHELAQQNSRKGKLAVRQVLATADASRLEVLLSRAVTPGIREILVATHVPPYVEALRPGSRADNPDWYPLMVCRAVGDVLDAFAMAHPGIDITVLAGHCHAPHQLQRFVNLQVRVAAARYGKPALGMTMLSAQ